MDRFRRDEQGRNEPPIVAGHVPPHDLDAEAAVLSSILLRPGAFDSVVDILKRDHFYSDANGRIYEAAQALATAGTPIDVVSVASWLRDRERLGKIGGAAYLAQLSDATPAVGNVPAYAQIVYQKWRVRQLIATCQRIAAEGYGDVGDANEFIDQAEAKIHGIASESQASEVTPTMRETLQQVFQSLQSVEETGGVYSGLKDLDRMMGPMNPGNLVVVGAHSGIGKTAVGMQMIMSVADPKGGAPTTGACVFSHEMTREELALRTLFSRARVDSSKVASKNTITPNEWDQLAEAAQGMALDNVWFDDRPGLTPLQIRAKARRVAAEADRAGTPLRIMLVDYLQLLDGSKGGGRKQAERRDQEIAYCSQKLKELAKELGIVVVLLAQLNDDSRKEKRPPRKEDLRECKAVAQDADKVILLHNPAAAERALARRRGQDVERPLEAEFVDIILDKNRGSKTGKVGALFFPTYVLFADPSEEDYERFDRGN
ncbi:replicative DNA helicase [Sorangium sp. So ce118]